VVSYNLFWWNAFQQTPSKSESIVYNIQYTLRPDTIGMQECNSAGTIQSKTTYQPASQWNDNNGVSVRPGALTALSSGSRNLNARGRWGNRYVNWAKLRHQSSGRSFWHFNTHWCCCNGNGYTCDADTRYRGAQNMLQAIQQTAGSEPVVITGDFNAGQGERSIQLFLNSGFRLAQWNYVDAVFYSSAHWTKINSSTGSAAGSDHPPVIANLQLNR